MKKNQESIHQEFGRFIRNEMDDLERANYLKTDRYKKSKELISSIFKKNSES